MNDKILQILNEALVLDRAAISQLALIRVPINDSLRDHSSIQVLCDERGTDFSKKLLE